MASEIFVGAPIITQLPGIPQPQLPAIGNAYIYFDQISGKIKASENGAPYVDMIGGGGGGDLQDAYDAGNTILLAGALPVSITNPAASATPVLSLTQGTAGQNALAASGGDINVSGGNFVTGTTALSDGSLARTGALSIAAVGAAVDLTLSARGVGTTLSQAGEATLDAAYTGVGRTSIIGALNSLVDGAVTPTAPPLSSVLAIGNTTGANNIIVSAGQRIDTALAGILDLGTIGATTAVNIGSTGNPTNLPGNVIVGGDLTVNGTVTTINSTNTSIADQLLIIASTTPAQIFSAYTIERGASGDDLLFLWNPTNTRTEIGFFDTVGGTVAPASALATLSDLRANNLSVAGTTITADAALTVAATGAANDLSFTGRSATTALNQAGETVLDVAFTGAGRTSIIGALNALVDGTVPTSSTLQQAYTAGTGAILLTLAGGPIAITNPAATAQSGLTVVQNTAGSFAIDATGDVRVTGKLTVGGAIDPTSISFTGAAASIFINSVTSTAAVSAAGEGRLRFVTGTGFQISTDGGAYATIATGTPTLQQVYASGNTIAATAARPVAFSNAVDATDLLTLTRTFAGAGSGLAVSMGATTTGNGLDVTMTAGAAGLAALFSGASISCPGAGADSERFGSGALAAGADSLSVGKGASASAVGATAVGKGASAVATATAVGSGATAAVIGATTLGFSAIGSATSTIALGPSATASAARAFAIGEGSSASFANSMAFGASATTTATDQIVFGSTSHTLSDLYLGTGVAVAAPFSFTIHPSGGLGAAVAGALIRVAGGTSGDAATVGGDVRLGVSLAGSGTTTTDVVYVTGGGTVGRVGIGAAPGAFELDVTGSARVTGKLTVGGAIDPTSISFTGAAASIFINSVTSTAAVSAAGEGRLRFVSGTGWQASSDGGAYATLATATSSTLQAAYAAGNTIAATAARTISFSNAVDATDLLTLTRTFAGAGAGLSLSMGATTTGSGISVAATAGAAGYGIIVDSASTFPASYFVSAGVVAASHSVQAEQTGTGLALCLYAPNTGTNSGGVIAVHKRPSAGAANGGIGIDVLMGGAGGVTTGSGISVTMTTAQASGSAISVTGGTQTTSAPVFTATQAWSAGGVTFRGLELAVTDTASAAASTLFRLNAGAAGTTEKFSIGGTGKLVSSVAETSGFIWTVAGGSAGADPVLEVYGGALRGVFKMRALVYLGNLGGSRTGVEIFDETAGAIDVGGGFSCAGWSDAAKTIPTSFATMTGHKENATDGNRDAYAAITTYVTSASGQRECVRWDSARDQRVPSGSVMGWSSSATNAAANDTGFSRISASSVALGNGTAGNGVGSLTLVTLTSPSGSDLLVISASSGATGQTLSLKAGNATTTPGSLSMNGGTNTSSGSGGGWSLYAGAASGADQGGAVTALSPGAGTGIGAPGTISIVLPVKAASGSTVQTAVTTITFQGNQNNLSGTTNVMAIAPTWADAGSTSTTVAQTLLINPTINYTAGSRTGRYECLVVNPTLTSEPTGANRLLALRTGGTNRLDVDVTGLLTTVKSVATAGWGVPSIYGSGRSTAQTAAVATVATYTVGAADGSFDVTANVNVTASTTNSFTVTVTYTDETSTSRTTTFSFVQNGAPVPIQTITNVTGAGAYSGLLMRIRAQAGTTITVATTGTFTTVTYNVEADIRQVS